MRARCYAVAVRACASPRRAAIRRQNTPSALGLRCTCCAAHRNACAAPSIGSLVATATSGWTGRVHRHGLAVIWAAAGWGVGITALGFAPNLGLAVLALAFAGGADMISGIFRGTIWNTTIPDHLRGRLAGIEQVSYSAGPLLGNLEAGVVASLAGVRASIVSGGVLCVAGVALAALALPAFRLYDARRAGPAGS